MIPFEQRVRLFQALLRLDSGRYQSEISHLQGRATRVQIRRAALLEDSFTGLGALPRARLKGRIQVLFCASLCFSELG